MAQLAILVVLSIFISLQMNNGDVQAEFTVHMSKIMTIAQGTLIKLSLTGLLIPRNLRNTNVTLQLMHI